MASRRFDKRPRFMRKRRIRTKINGAGARPRLSVFRSNKHIHAQIINDVAGATLAAASSIEKNIAAKSKGLNKTDVSELVGKALGERALKANINKVVFDRSGYKYHGRVKRLAETVRQCGVIF